MANLSILYNLLKKLNDSDDKQKVINNIIKMLLDEGIITKDDVDDSIKSFLEMTKDLEDSMSNGKSYQEAYDELQIKHSGVLKNFINLN